MGLQGDCYVSDLEVYDDLLWVTGFFFTDAGNAATGVMAWNGEQWLDPFPQAEMYGWGRSLTVANGKLYFVGPMNVDGLTGTYQIGEYDGNTLCIRGGNVAWPTLVVASPDTLFAKVCTQLGCNENGGPVVNGIVKMPLDYPADTCFVIGVGVAEAAQKDRHQFTVFPNPAIGTVTVIGFTKATDDLRCELTDATGRILLRTGLKTTGGSVFLDINGIAPGVYSMALRDESGIPVFSDTLVIEK